MWGNSSPGALASRFARLVEILGGDTAAAKAGKFSALDWLRILFALGLLTLGPSLSFEYFAGLNFALKRNGPSLQFAPRCVRPGHPGR